MPIDPIDGFISTSESYVSSKGTDLSSCFSVVLPGNTGVDAAPL